MRGVMSPTEKFFKLAQKMNIPYEIYTGDRVDRGNGQGGCYWSGNKKKLMVWDKIKAIDIAHEIGHYLTVENPQQYSINNYGLDLKLYNSMKQEKNACLLHFHLCNLFNVSKDEIEADMDNCSFLSKYTKPQVFADSEEYAMMNHRDVVLAARIIQGEQNAN
jgi:hypothetical protein